MTYTAAQIAELLPYLTEDEKKQVSSILQLAPIWAPLPGPQSMAFYSPATVLGYGGAAGGGKTDLIAGLTLTSHRRALIVRREKAQTEGIVQRLTELLGNTTGYNSQKGVWKLPVEKQCLVEFAGLDNAGDEHRFQGRAHDLKAFDEVTEQREAQVRFLMGWRRSNVVGQHTRVLMTFNPPTTSEGRWVLDYFAPWLDKTYPVPADPGEIRYFARVVDKDEEVVDEKPFVLVNQIPVYDFDPADFRPEEVITPVSRTFIPARLTDNPYYMATGYMATLQALPEPLRSQMLYGDFTAGMEDSPWQVIPTAWVEEAMRRWEKKITKPRMDSMGIDVARGGADNTVIARRHGDWFDELLAYPATQTPDGPTVAALALTNRRDKAPIHIDVIGVGASPYDFLRAAPAQVIGVNFANSASESDKSGTLQFANMRAQCWWKLREALDPANNRAIALPPDSRLLADLCAPTWFPRGKMIYVESREEIIKRIGRSPDYGTAVILALMNTPRLTDIPGTHNAAQREHNPYANLRRQ